MHSSRIHTARSSSHSGGSPPGPKGQGTPPHPPGPNTPRDQVNPAMDRHTPVNILPCPKLRLRAVKKQKKCFSKRKLIICRFDNQLMRGSEVANVVTAVCLQTLSHLARVNMQHCRFDNQLTRGTAVCLQTLSHVINRTINRTPST